ncbi:MAG: hypothetical protein JWR56_1947 [Massilia sp.]|nr:hypothetical protein [Massilia sp.]
MSARRLVQFLGLFGAVQCASSPAWRILLDLVVKLSGVKRSDQVTVSGVPTSGTFADKNVGLLKPVTTDLSGAVLSGLDAGNYTLTGLVQPLTAKITPAKLVATATAQSKIYDGTSLGAITLGDNRIAGDVLSVAYAAANFNNKKAGLNKTVSVTGITVTDADAGNYVLKSATISTKADIAKASLTEVAFAQNKVYDGKTADIVTFTDNRIAGDVFAVRYKAAFADALVGTGKLVSVSGIRLSGADAGNYALTSTTDTATADITPRP